MFKRKWFFRSSEWKYFLKQGHENQQRSFRRFYSKPGNRFAKCGIEYEQHVLQVLREFDFFLKQTPKSHDGGIDLVGGYLSLNSQYNKGDDGINNNHLNPNPNPNSNLNLNLNSNSNSNSNPNSNSNSKPNPNHNHNHNQHNHHHHNNSNSNDNNNNGNNNSNNDNNDDSNKESNDNNDNNYNNNKESLDVCVIQGRTSIRTIVQCKYSASKVSTALIREFEGTLSRQLHISLGIFSSTSGFSSKVLKELDKSKMALILLQIPMNGNIDKVTWNRQVTKLLPDFVALQSSAGTGARLLPGRGGKNIKH